MNNEGMHGALAAENEAKYLKETNGIEKALFEHWHGYKDEEKFVNEWIPRYADRFHDLFKDEMKADPGLIEGWKNPATCEAVIERFEKALYGEHYSEEVAQGRPGSY